jgi:hypothetical protein
MYMPDHLLVLLMRAVRKIQSEHIHSLLYQSEQFFIGIAGWAYSGDNFGFV